MQTMVTYLRRDLQFQGDCPADPFLWRFSSLKPHIPRASTMDPTGGRPRLLYIYMHLYIETKREVVCILLWKVVDRKVDIGRSHGAIPRQSIRVVSDQYRLVLCRRRVRVEVVGVEAAQGQRRIQHPVLD